MVEIRPKKTKIEDKFVEKFLDVEEEIIEIPDGEEQAEE